METCANNSFVDYLLMFGQLIGIGLVVLIIMGYVQRAIQKAGDAAWSVITHSFKTPKDEQ